jgi:pullulanase
MTMIAKYLAPCLCFLSLSSGATALAAPALIEDCDRPDHQRVLSAVLDQEKLAAEAVWMDAQHLRWPGASVTGRYRLYYSSDAQLQLSKNKMRGADGFIELESVPSIDSELSKRFSYVQAGVDLRVVEKDRSRLKQALRSQLQLVHEDSKGRVIKRTRAQIAAALDSLYPSAYFADSLGVNVQNQQTRFQLWAPTAQQVSACIYPSAQAQSVKQLAMGLDSSSGLWSVSQSTDFTGGYYRYLVDVVVPNVGLVRNVVTDPYSISLNANSQRSFIANLDDARLKPSGWDEAPLPNRVKHMTDMLIYELHVRDFSINDASVNQINRGKYRAFTETRSRGMQHLKQLSDAGITDIHFLPVFDLATVPEKNCVTPDIDAKAASTAASDAHEKTAGQDCFNWGYDPFHFNAAEGSYSSDADDGAARIREFREMVLALHRANLRVGMDVVYNHTSASGQDPRSVLDRVVPGYYQRLNSKGDVERSTCCENTATEHRMMEKLMIDSSVLWAKHYKIDSFRFDLMGHQPRAAMERLQQRVNQDTGRDIHLIGEGWNFGEVANGERFVQASQLSLNGSRIATFSDRARDAARGGSAMDSGKALVENQGYINGLSYAPNEFNKGKNQQNDLLRSADMLRVGLAGTIRNFRMQTASGEEKRLEEMRYGDAPAGYVSSPQEVVNYVENHDNQTLFDINAYKLPLNTSKEDRARVQLLALSINTLSQGVAYYHAGGEILRSKSLDANSYDSGDWFNRIDWSLQDNYFATGLPPKRDNQRSYEWMTPRLQNASIKPDAAQIQFTYNAFLDLLKIRSSTTLLRLHDETEIQKRLQFYNTGPNQTPTVLVGHLDGRQHVGLYPGAQFRELVYFVNVENKELRLQISELSNKRFVLHPVQSSANAADQRPRRLAKYQASNGEFVIPARTTVVFVVEARP